MKVTTLILLSWILFQRISADPTGSRRIRSRSDIPVEDDELAGFGQMDQEIKKDLDRFKEIKEVGSRFQQDHWQITIIARLKSGKDDSLLRRGLSFETDDVC